MNLFRLADYLKKPLFELEDMPESEMVQWFAYLILKKEEADQGG